MLQHSVLRNLNNHDLTCQTNKAIHLVAHLELSPILRQVAYKILVEDILPTPTEYTQKTAIFCVYL